METAPIRRIDFHHQAQVIVQANLTTAVTIANTTKGTKMEPKRAAFLLIMEKAEEALARAEANPEE